MSTATLDTTTVRRWKRYPETRALPLDWTLTIPAHWKIRRLKEVATVRPSNVDKKSVEGERAVHLCNYVDVYKNDKITTDMEFMPATATEAQIAQFSISAGDVIITKDSETWDDIAVPAYVPETIDGLVCGYHLALIRPDARCLNGAYLARCFAAEGLADQFRVAANGITRYGLDTQSIKCAVFPLPPLAEQRAIAAFLDRETARIDALIGHKERLIALLEEKRQAVISHAVTRGLDPSVKRKPAGLAWLDTVPHTWDIKRNAALFAERDERGYTNFPVLEVSIRTGVTVREFSSEHIEQQYEDPAMYKRANRGDIVFNKMRMWQGAVGVAPVDGLVSPDYTVARPLDGVNTAYFAHLFRTPWYLTEIDRYSHGMVKDRNRLYWDDFKQMPSIVPPLTAQAQIVDHISGVTEHNIAVEGKIREGIARLQEYRTALISAAVTGQIDVRGEVE